MHFHLVYVCVCQINGLLKNLPQHKMDIMKAQVFAGHASSENQQFFCIWLSSRGLFIHLTLMLDRHHSLSNILKQEWTRYISALCLFVWREGPWGFPHLMSTLIFLVWHNGAQGGYIGQRERVQLRRVTQDCSLKPARIPVCLNVCVTSPTPTHSYTHSDNLWRKVSH